jgi:hypothetical protein
VSIFNRVKRSGQTYILAAPADQHVNSTVGVLPKYAELVEGGFHRNGPVQNWIWRKWLESWEGIWTLKKETGGKLIVLNLGDALDDPKHATTQIVSGNKASILRMAARVFERPREMADWFFVLRGTEAHTGLSATWEELLAEDLDAERSPDGLWSWWYWEGVVGGVWVDAAHHPQTAGRLPHTQAAAPSRQSFMLELQAVRSERQVPDVALRAHAHYAGDSGVFTRPRTFYCPPWQLTSAFGHRLGAGAFVRPVGTLALIIRDRRVTPVTDYIYRAPRREPWTVE